MAWKKKLCTADTTVCNGPCRVKKVCLYHTSATTADIYDEADDSTTAAKKVWTLATHGTTTIIFKDEIDFGDEGAFFNYGCHIDWTAGEILVVYKN